MFAFWLLWACSSMLGLLVIMEKRNSLKVWPTNKSGSPSGLRKLQRIVKGWREMHRNLLKKTSVVLATMLILSACGAQEKQLVPQSLPPPPVSPFDPIPQEALPWLQCLYEKGSNSLDCRSLEPSLSLKTMIYVGPENGRGTSGMVI